MHQCEDCNHAFARDDEPLDDDTPHIECRRFPPQVWFNPEQGEPEQGFPWAGAVCGEFQPIEVEAVNLPPRTPMWDDE